MLKRNVNLLNVEEPAKRRFKVAAGSLKLLAKHQVPYKPVLV
jgi:hypothetical protein